MVQEHYGLDRARLQALGFALDGPDPTFTGRVRVVQVIKNGDKRCAELELDVLDERVAFLVLNQIKLPRAA
ncbi:hypothetical protein [Sphingosinicella humi]|uniref:hypothetical protein n=1 Tax=Allosphingosinicella humi TaxID=2068657 RepID=UPI0011B2276B|nr:hypothetical protein [Sphingosinicella humi]